MITKVNLRQKAISKGRQSLYLDFYPAIPDPKKPGKTTRREFLRLYLFDKPRNPIDKKHNKETLLIAQSIRQKKENQLNKPEIYDEYEREQLRKKEMADSDFISYFESLANKRKGSTNSTWKSALNYLRLFFGESYRFGDLDVKKLDEFKEFLLTTKSIRSDRMTLSQNSASSYFAKVKAALKQAYKEGYLSSDLNSKVDPIKEAESRIEFLSVDEMKKLISTHCKDNIIKRAAIFSALTGLATRELQNLTWRDITHSQKNGYRILSNRDKTKKDNYLPISEEAYGFTLGNKDPRQMPPDEKVFKDLKYTSYRNNVIKQWVRDAKIDKHITFHCFRHTYATLQIYFGTDLYTVSKMLGHSNVTTTQIYAKVMDESKRKAADRIKLDL